MDRELQPLPPSPIHQVAFVVLAGQCVLAIATRAGLSVWDPEPRASPPQSQQQPPQQQPMRLLHRRALAASGVPDEQAAAHFARGLAASPRGAGGGDALFCGTSWGEVLVSRFLDAGASGIIGAGVPGASLVGGHRAAITSVAADERCVVSADDAGVLAQWEAPTASAASARAPVAVLDKGAGAPCTSLALQGPLIVAGYASGHVRIFRQGGGGGGAGDAPLRPAVLEAEIGAHARCVTALSFHPSRPTFASVGEDCMLNVWSLPEAPVEGGGVRVRVLLDLAAPIRDRLLAGVAFARPGGRGSAVHVVASAYDVASLFVFLGI